MRRVLGALPGSRGRGGGAPPDARWRDGTARPLEGVPLAVKDLFDTEGVETTYGTPMFRGHVPERDAEAVRRCREAGAIVLGKTATHEFAWGYSSINDAMGTVRNPRDPERVAGGSSGGSAAAAGRRPRPAGARDRHRRLDPRPRRVLRRPTGSSRRSAA